MHPSRQAFGLDYSSPSSSPTTLCMCIADYHATLQVGQAVMKGAYDYDEPIMTGCKRPEPMLFLCTFA